MKQFEKLYSEIIAMGQFAVIWKLTCHAFVGALGMVLGSVDGSLVMSNGQTVAMGEK